MTNKTNETPKESDLPWYPFYVYDWQSDEAVRLMTYEERGIYHELLNIQWIEGSIPASEDLLARLLSLSGDTFSFAWDRIRDKFARHWDKPTRLVNMKLHGLREDAMAKVDQAREWGRAGAEKRWGHQREGSSQPVASPIAPPKGDHKPADSYPEPQPDPEPQPPTSPDSAPARAEPKKRGPDSWLTPFDDEWARTHGGTPFLKKGAKTGGEMGKWLKIVKREILEQDRLIIDKDQLNEMFKRWRSFLAETGQFATMAKFAKEHGLHKKGKFVGGHDVRRARPREPAGRDKPKLTPSI